MKYIKWLWENHFEKVMTVLAAVAFTAGMVVAAITCNDLDKQHESAVAAGVFDVSEVEAEEQAVETDAVETDQTEETRTYFDVPLSEDLQNHIFAVCEEKGIDPAIIVAMCFRESTYNASKIGDGGNSFGIMQIQPRHHYERMLKLGCTDLLDPFQNITVGIDYLCEQLNRYDGDMAKALVGYNSGHFSGTVTQYARNVLETAEGLVIA